MVCTSNKPKMKEDIAKLKVAVPIRDLWKAMSIDIRHIVPKVLPDIVEEVELLEGDGGHGSVLLFKFFPHIPKVNFQRRRLWSMTNRCIRSLLKYWKEGIWIMGFQDTGMFFKLTAIGEGETLIDFKVVYETEQEHTHMPGELTKETLHYLKLLENYMLNGSS